MSAVAVEHARQQWAEGHRRLQSHASEGAAYNRLHAQVEVIVDELGRRLGQTFTLAELARAYRVADSWTNSLIPLGGAAGDPAIVEDAAFHLFARGAVDYEP